MCETNNNMCPWMALTVRSTQRTAIWQGFCQVSDQDAIAACIEQYRQYEIYRSIATYIEPQLASTRIAPFYFVIVCPIIRLIREYALNTCLYLKQRYSIPTDCIDLIYDGASQIHIIIAPVVIGLPPDNTTTWANYLLARKLFKECSTAIDLDVYYRAYEMLIPNSCNSRNMFIVSITFDELLNIEMDAIQEIATSPRPEMSMVVPYPNEMASTAIKAIIELSQAERRQQACLCNKISEEGWYIPDCIASLMEQRYVGNTVGEAQRIVAQYLSLIGANYYEIMRNVNKVGSSDKPVTTDRIRAIVLFAKENPTFCGCTHKLLIPHCNRQNCAIARILNNFEKHPLFVDGGIEK